MSPTLLTPAKVWWVWSTLPVALADAALIGAMVLLARRAPVALWVRTLVAFVLLADLACSACLGGISLLVDSTSFLVLAAALLLAIWACMPLPARGAALVIALLVTSALMKLTASGLHWLQEADDALVGSGGSIQNAPYIAEQIYWPGRHYRMSHSRDGKLLAVFLPHPERTEIFDVTQPEQPPLLAGGGWLRLARHPTTGELAVVAQTMGVWLQDPDRPAAPRALWPESSFFFWMGVAWTDDGREVAALRADGRILVLSRDGAVQRELWVPAPRVAQWNEQFNELYLFPGDRAIVSEQLPPAFYAFDFVTGELTAKLSAYGVAGNLVSRDNGETVIGFFGRGGLQQRRSDDLTLLRQWSAGFGMRFVQLFPDRRHLALANYITGDVYVLDLDGDVRYGPFRTAPRLEWMEVAPGAKLLDVSHGQGITRLHIADLTREPPSVPPLARFPIYLFRPRVALHLVTSALRSPRVLLCNWLLFVAAVVVFRRLLARSAAKEVCVPAAREHHGRPHVNVREGGE